MQLEHTLGLLQVWQKRGQGWQLVLNMDVDVDVFVFVK